MKIIIDIPDEKVKAYAMMYKTFTSDDELPSDFDESVEKAIGAGTVDLDLSVFGEDQAKQMEMALTMAAIVATGLKQVDK